MRKIMKKQKSCYSHIKTGIALLSGLILFTGALLLPHGASAATISCSSGVSGCHFTPTVKDGTGRNVPSGRFLGSHATHAGYSTSSAKGQYAMVCTKCHGLASGYNNAHQTGFKNVSGSSLPGNRYSAGKKIANTNSPVFGNCGNIYCHSTGRASGMGLVQYSSARWGGTETCLGCHGGRASATGNPARSVGNFTLSTSHSQHLKYTAAEINCQMCHAKTSQTDAWTLKTYTAATHHVNGVREVTFTTLTYGSYTSFKSTESGSSANTKVCTNVACHGGKTRGAWSNTVQNTNHTCTHCHGTATGIATNNTNRNFYAPGYNSGTSTDGNSIATDVRVGAHLGHLSSVYMKKLKCNECHRVPSIPFEATHMTGPRYSSQSINFGQASSAIKNTTTTAFTSGTAATAATCTTTYCHGSKMIYGDNLGTNRSPTWNAELITRSPGAVECERCHGNPPDSGTSTKTADHIGKAATTSCNECHSHVNTNGTFNDKSLHINGIIEASGTCVGCHASVQTGTHGTPRDAVVGEFTLAWGHKKSGRGAVTDADCIVCHLEGVFATQAPSATYHKDGNIDLRDPDGTGEARITNISNASYTFTKFATSYASGARTSTGHTANTVDNIITQKFCLKCHDAGGATNTSARSGTSPTATNPFGTGKLAINNAAEFATTNSSKHPVLGPLSRDYPAATRMAVPYKPTGTRGTSGTKTAGVVMNCFDCHNTPTTPLTTRTVSAHGNANTIRGTIGVASPTLCAICHLGYTGSTTVGHNSASGFTSGSAYSSAENRMQTEQNTCEYCHADVLAPARPARATNVHGTNVLPTGGATKTLRWLAGGTTGVPVAFIRNTTYLTNHSPKNVAGTPYTPQCSMTNCAGRAGSPYSLGGTY